MKILELTVTCVESLQFVAGSFGIMHALEERTDASVIFTPEVIRNYEELLDVRILTGSNVLEGGRGSAQDRVVDSVGAIDIAQDLCRMSVG